MIQSIGQGNQCAKEAEAEPTPPAVADLDKCKDKKNDALPECICLKAPRTVGCSNGLQKPGENSSSNNPLTASTDKTNTSGGGGADLSGLGGLNDGLQPGAIDNSSGSTQAGRVVPVRR